MAAVLERFGLKKRVNAARALDPLTAIAISGPWGPPSVGPSSSPTPSPIQDIASLKIWGKAYALANALDVRFYVVYTL